MAADGGWCNAKFIATDIATHNSARCLRMGENEYAAIVLLLFTGSTSGGAHFSFLCSSSIFPPKIFRAALTNCERKEAKGKDDAVAS